jgi:hypothetical protein
MVEKEEEEEEEEEHTQVALPPQRQGIEFKLF